MIKRIIVAGLIGAALAVPAQAQRVGAREHRQSGRIVQGVRSGELTRGETRSLARQQGRIDRSAARMRASGGGLSRSERARLEYRQDRASAHIYAAKHNGRVR